MFDKLYPFRGLEWRRFFHQYTTPRDWKRGARDIPFGLGAKTLYVDGTNGDDHNDGLSWKTAFKTIQHAIDEADSWTRIFIKNGTYVENIEIPSSKSSLSLIGESWKGVVIDGGSAMSRVLSNFNFLQNLYFKSAVESYPTLHVDGDRNTLRNCFFENSASPDTFECSLAGDDNLISHCETAGSASEGAIGFTGKRNEVCFCRVIATNTNYAIKLFSDAEESLVHDCSFLKAKNYAVGLLFDSSLNFLFHNNFIDNTNAISDDGIDNKFFENFYDDHSNIDNGFGIATEPYTFSDGSDPRPVVCRNGWLTLSWSDADLVSPILANQKKYWHWNAISGDYHVIQGTWQWHDSSDQYLGGWLGNESSNAVHDEIRIPFFCPSTDDRTLHLRCYTDEKGGTVTVYVDGQSQGTLNTYSADPTSNVIKTLSITPARAGLNVLSFKLTGSESGLDFLFRFSELWLT